MINEKEKSLQEYLNLTFELLSHVKSENFDSLEELFDLRDSIILKIEELDKKNGSIMMNEQIKALLLSIQEVETLFHQETSNQKEHAMNEIQKIKKSKTANLKYGQTDYLNPSEGFFYDIKK